jgi:hypothetical protein
MRYAQHRSTVRRTRRSSRRSPIFVLFFLLLAGSFGGWFWHTRTTETVASEPVPSVEEPSVQEESDIVPVVESALAAVTPESASAQEEKSKVIDLIYLETGSGFTASASRGIGEGQYTVKVVALPPAIDDLSMTYEAWIVKPGVTDYFSLGTLARREDGKWQVIWKQDIARVRPDMDQFTKVIVTREARDGNTLPSPQHVFEGTFE